MNCNDGCCRLLFIAKETERRVSIFWDILSPMILSLGGARIGSSPVSYDLQICQVPVGRALHRH